MQPMPPEQIQAQQRGQMPDGQESEPGSQDSLTEMIIQTDQALTGIAQVIEKASPEMGKALAQVNDQYRAIVSAFMNQIGGNQPRAASPMVGPETQGKPAMQAY